MLHSLYAHLWSIADRGAVAFVDDLERAGLGAVSYAATYHAVRQLLPADPRRAVFHSPRSHAYFRPGASYGAVCPLPSPLLDAGGAATLGALAGELRRRDMRLKAWVIGCHNSDLVALHPDLAVRNALDDALPHYLCPARPAVREYLGVLAADFARQFDPYAFELESFDYPGGFEHGAHHEMSGVPLDPMHGRLLALCFCGACRREARAHGVDADALAPLVRAELRAYLETPAWRLAARGRAEALDAEAAFAQAHPELEAYEAMRRAVCRAVGMHVRDAVREVSRAKVTNIGFGPPDQYPDIAEWADGLVVASTPAAVRDARRVMAARPDAEITCGVYPMAPRLQRPADVLPPCVRAGCTGFNYYNHALMQACTWEEIAAAVAALGAGGA